MIYNAILLNPDAIIAAETDAVFSTAPLDLPCTDDLGDWERKEYTEIVYLQSGFYYATKSSGEIICKYRGMDRDRETGQPKGLPYRKILDHLARNPKPEGYCTDLLTHTTRFIGLGMGLKTKSTWRSWEHEPKRVSLDQKPWFNKRYHVTDECPECEQGASLYDCLHTMNIGGYAGKSFARTLPWRHLAEEEKEVAISQEEWLEMNPEFLVFEEADRWS